MSSPKPSSLYPQVILSNPEQPTSSSSSSSSLYPSIDMKGLAQNLFPDNEDSDGNAYSQSSEQVLITIPGTIVHLIERQNSIELASGDFSVVSLRQGDNVVAVLARVGDEIQWPLAKDEPAVKLDDSHYFFTLRVPPNEDEKEAEMLNYGLTVASKGQDGLMKKLDGILEQYSCFSVEKVEVDGSVARGISPEELSKKEKKEMLEDSSAAYWTTVAPNVDDYSGKVARLIAAGSGQLIRGILWCGDVTVGRLNWGNEFLKKRMGPCSDSEICPAALKRMKRYFFPLGFCWRVGSF